MGILISFGPFTYRFLLAVSVSLQMSENEAMKALKVNINISQIVC